MSQPRPIAADETPTLKARIADLEARLREQDKTISDLRAQNAEFVRRSEAEKAKSFFFSTVSHDIRTPLNAIIGFSEMLKLGVRDPAERKKYIDSILVSGKTLLQLINDVLDLSQLEAGKMEILPEPTDCGRLIAEILQSFKSSVGKKAVALRGVVKPMPLLQLDPQRLRQILFNLVGNSTKFTERGHIEVRARYDGGTFVMEVEDTGCGISDEDLQRIASPYVQVGNPTSRHGGTGLGLSICKQLVFRMGGEIDIVSQVGRGTRFTVTLHNVKTVTSATLLSMTQQIQIAATAPVSSLMPKHALLADDSAINLAVLKSMLVRFGVRKITTVSTGKEALDKLLADATYDLVLTDMWMPVMGGEELVRKIRRIPKLSKLRVYAVTADVEVQKDYAKMGFTGLLLKPLTLEKIRTLFR